VEAPNNLLVRLHKWAIRQDENFLTEAFAHLLQHLLSQEPEAGLRLIARLTNGVIVESVDRAKLIEIRTQIVSGEGTPDIQFRSANAIVIVEVKSESGLNPEQLVRYRGILEKERRAGFRTGLVVLTRYAVDLADDTLKVRWYEIAQWISEESQRYAFQAVSAYLSRQFIEFLRERDMVMEQVTWELTGGVRALRSLVDMLYETALACQVTVKRSVGWDYIGIKLDGKYWVGIMLDDPENLHFSTSCVIDADAAAKLDVGEVWQENWVPGRNIWGRSIQLDSEDTHFFSRTRPGQMQWLEKFLRESLGMAQRIEMPNQPPAADEPDEE
jgi:hypothetical protein